MGNVGEPTQFRRGCRVKMADTREPRPLRSFCLGREGHARAHFHFTSLTPLPTTWKSARNPAARLNSPINSTDRATLHLYLHQYIDIKLPALHYLFLH
jgi:hypothetical protein